MIRQINNGIVDETTGNVVYILDGVAAPADSPIIAITPKDTAWFVSLRGSGVITATVLLNFSLTPNVPESFITLKTFSLSGSDNVSDGFTVTFPWHYFQIKLTVITGTNAKLYALVAV